MLADNFKDVFPELQAQYGFVQKVVEEEEKAFLRTLAAGIKRIDNIQVQENQLDGEIAFELFDTYGFPIDLTRLIASEKGWKIDEDGFNKALQEQKDRARADAKRETGDWTIVKEVDEVEFLGYDNDDAKQVSVSRYRVTKEKDKEIYQLVLDKTPFYPEGGGQIGDKGSLDFDGERIHVLNTIRENDLIIHIVDKFPSDHSIAAEAEINSTRRKLIENNHTATHLMHAALRQVLGTHVQQKGSLVKDNMLRFDFSHFQKMTAEEIAQVEGIVNKKIRENIPLLEHRSISIAEAKDAGAIMLFGEKYGDYVRMITFDPEFSRELCGGCHVNATGSIGHFKIKSEAAISTGIRRIEAVTADALDAYYAKELEELSSVRALFKNPKNVAQTIASLQEENKKLQKEIDKVQVNKAAGLKDALLGKAVDLNGIRLIAEKVDIADAKVVKTLAFNLEKELEDGVILLATESEGKAQLLLSINKALVESKSLNASNIIREISKHINGGGGGQAFFATAGGKNPDGIPAAIEQLKTIL